MNTTPPVLALLIVCIQIMNLKTCLAKRCHFRCFDRSYDFRAISRNHFASRVSWFLCCVQNNNIQIIPMLLGALRSITLRVYSFDEWRCVQRATHTTAYERHNYVHTRRSTLRGSSGRLIWWNRCRNVAIVCVYMEWRSKMCGILFGLGGLM